MVSVLLAEGTDGVLPFAFVATAVNVPTVSPASVSVIVAEVPSPLMFTFETVIAAGVKTGKKENVAPVRFEPFTWKLTVGEFSTCAGLTEVITGTASTVKLLLEVAVEVPTVTLTGPVVTSSGTSKTCHFERSGRSFLSFALRERPATQRDHPPTTSNAIKAAGIFVQFIRHLEIVVLLPTDVYSLNTSVLVQNTNLQTRPNGSLAERGIVKTGRGIERVVMELDSVNGKGFSCRS